MGRQPECSGRPGGHLAPLRPWRCRTGRGALVAPERYDGLRIGAERSGYPQQAGGVDTGACQGEFRAGACLMGILDPILPFINQASQGRRAAGSIVQVGTVLAIRESASGLYLVDVALDGSGALGHYPARLLQYAALGHRGAGLSEHPERRPPKRQVHIGPGRSRARQRLTITSLGGLFRPSPRMNTG